MKWVFKSLQMLALLFLLSPLVYSIYILFSEKMVLNVDFGLDLLTVILQASLSASFSLVFGTLSAVSILSQVKHKSLVLHLGLIPQFLPSLLMIFAYVKLYSYFNVFPQSYWHVIAVHALLNIGLVTYLVYPSLQESVEKKMHLFASLGLSKWRYLFLTFISELRQPLTYAFSLVFSYCLTSFSVPLILSARSSTSFEHLIYKKGFIEGDWGQAAFWGLVQVVFVALLFFMRPQSLKAKQQNRLKMFKISFPFFIFAVLPSLLILLSMIPGDGEKFLVALSHLREDALEIFMNTSLLCLWTLFFYSIFYWSQVLMVRQKWTWFFYQKYWPLSPILLGLYLMALGSYFQLGRLGGMILSGLVLASFAFPLVFKFWIWPKYQDIQGLSKKIKALSLVEDRAINEILISYFTKDFKLSLVYVFLLALGDFVISSILLSDTPNLGLSIRNYIFKYNLVEAQILCAVLALVAAVCFVFYQRGENDFN